MYRKNILTLALTVVIVLLALIMGGIPFTGFFIFFLFGLVAVACKL